MIIKIACFVELLTRCIGPSMLYVCTSVGLVSSLFSFVFYTIRVSIMWVYIFFDNNRVWAYEGIYIFNTI